MTNKSKLTVVSLNGPLHSSSLLHVATSLTAYYFLFKRVLLFLALRGLYSGVIRGPECAESGLSAKSEDISREPEDIGHTMRQISVPKSPELRRILNLNFAPILQ